MSDDIDPIVDNWYAHLDKGQRFTVVAVNEDEGLVEIQHYDGTLEEIDLDLWYGLEIEPSDEPENWSGSVDIGEVDDLGTEVTDTTSDDWQAPLQEVQEDALLTEDEWGDGRPEEEPLEGDV